MKSVRPPRFSDTCYQSVAKVLFAQTDEKLFVKPSFISCRGQALKGAYGGTSLIHLPTSTVPFSPQYNRALTSSSSPASELLQTTHLQTGCSATCTIVAWTPGRLSKLLRGLFLRGVPANNLCTRLGFNRGHPPNETSLAPDHNTCTSSSSGSTPPLATCRTDFEPGLAAN